jgi:hypothetical protein
VRYAFRIAVPPGTGGVIFALPGGGDLVVRLAWARSPGAPEVVLVAPRGDVLARSPFPLTAGGGHASLTVDEDLFDVEVVFHRPPAEAAAPASAPK